MISRKLEVLVGHDPWCEGRRAVIAQSRNQVEPFAHPPPSQLASDLEAKKLTDRRRHSISDLTASRSIIAMERVIDRKGL